MRSSLRASALALLGVAALAAQGLALDPTQPLPPGDEGQLLKVDDLRLQALVDADVGTLQGLLDDDLRYVHSDGRVDSKYVLIAALESRHTDYVSAKSRDVVARAYGDAGVVAGTAQMRVRGPGGAEQKLRSLYTAVYARREGVWRLVAYQATTAPGGS